MSSDRLHGKIMKLLIIILYNLGQMLGPFQTLKKPKYSFFIMLK